MRWLPAAALLVTSSVACSNDPFVPAIEDVEGTYDAVQFIARTGSGTTDYLAAGSFLTMNLNYDGTVTGFLHMVGGAAGGGDLDADLAGTWTLSGASVTFDQSADTFVRDVDFVATRDFQLEATWSGSGVRYHLELINADVVTPTAHR